MLDRAGPQGLFAIRSLTSTQECQQIWSSEVEGKGVEKNVPLSFLFFFSLLYPVYATNKFNFQELELRQSLSCLKWVVGSSRSSWEEVHHPKKSTKLQEWGEKGVGVGQWS